MMNYQEQRDRLTDRIIRQDLQRDAPDLGPSEIETAVTVAKEAWKGQTTLRSALEVGVKSSKKLHRS